MRVSLDGRSWRIGSAEDVAWIATATAGYATIAAAIPPVFDAYATFYEPEGVSVGDHERAVVRRLTAEGSDQPWWLGYLDTGAHDIVAPSAPRLQLYWDWGYVLIEAGAEQALSWRTGHMRAGDGALPDLFFPADRSWLVSALWDDTWTCFGGPDSLVETLVRDPLVLARRVRLGEDAKPPGRERD